MDAPGHDDDERAERPELEVTDVWQAPASPGPVARPSRDEPPAEADDSDLGRFVRDVDEAGLLAGDEVRAFLDRYAAGERPRDARRLARELVAAGKMTSYQAGAVCQGKAKGLVIGRFLVLDKLGSGGMGVVFKAEQRRLRRVVALKILPPSVTRDADLVGRFHREAEAAAKLDHPNLVRAIDADEAGGMHFLVMEFIDGKDLGKLVRERGPMAIGDAIGAVIHAARGLAAAHGLGIVHRDIKPSNLMLDSAGTVKVLDLGLARLDDPDLSDAGGGGLTLTNAFLGTADYMSPEQAFDPRLADARSDIYSLGCTLHYLLTARPVYGGRSLMQRLLGHREATIPSLRTTRPDVPPALDDAFRRMVAKRPEDRPATMAEVIPLLEASRPAADVASKAKPKSSPRVLKVFDDGKPAPTPTPRPSARREAVPEDEESTPLPRIGAPPGSVESDSDSEGSGFRSTDASGRVFTVHDADAIGFRNWINLVRNRGGIPTCISAFDGGGRPHFAAVAAVREGPAWEVMLHPDAIEFAKYAARMESQGLSLLLLGGYTTGARIGSVTLYRRASDGSIAEIGPDLDALRDRLDKLDKIPARLHGLHGYPTTEGARFALIWSPGDGRLQRRDVDMSAEELKVFLDRGARDDFRPVSLTSYAVGDSVRFGAVLRRGGGKAWEARLGLTSEMLYDELGRRTGRDLPPPLLCGYRQDDTTLYAATWAAGRARRRP